MKHMALRVNVTIQLDHYVLHAVKTVISLDHTSESSVRKTSC